jgi:peptide/nickel transport system substrate-binding protein
MNFTSGGDHGVAGKIISQTYFRQAMQTLVDQTALDQKIYKGYAVPTYGPVPVVPSTFASKLELQRGGPLPFSVSKASDLLSSHGWKVVPGGISDCQRPGTGSSACGAGIPEGTQLNFSILNAPASSSPPELMADELASWSLVGIHMTISDFVFDTGPRPPCSPPSSGPGCPWGFEQYGGSWNFSPDFYPSGEEIFASNAGANAGGFDDPTNDANIKATTDNDTDLIAYQNYLATQVPVIWQPVPAYQLTEVARNLRGLVGQQSPFGNILPEEWYFVEP